MNLFTSSIDALEASAVASLMPIPILHVDAFTRLPFAGNPAAVCFLERAMPDAWLLGVAAEMNLSETAFVRAEGDRFALRWFTPVVEVPLCGHATLASAHALWETGRLDGGREARFDTLSGPLIASRDGDVIAIDLPAMNLREARCPHEVIDAIPVASGAPCLEAVRSGGDRDLLIVLDEERRVREARPDFARLREVSSGVILTAPAAGRGFDFVSRYFAPFYGIDEDPVTGAAHCSLLPFWASRLGRDNLTGFQASSRGGIVRGRLRGDRVVLSGHAVTVAAGHLSPALEAVASASRHAPSV